MLRWSLLLILFVAGCSKGPEADLPSIGEARSLASEWALVNEQARRRQLTATYIRTMRESARKQLQTTAKSLTQPQSAYGQEIAALLREADGASPRVLRAHAASLKRIEDELESA